MKLKCRWRPADAYWHFIVNGTGHNPHYWPQWVQNLWDKVNP